MPQLDFTVYSLMVNVFSFYSFGLFLILGLACFRFFFFRAAFLLFLRDLVFFFYGRFYIRIGTWGWSRILWFSYTSFCCLLYIIVSLLYAVS